MIVLNLLKCYLEYFSLSSGTVFFAEYCTVLVMVREQYSKEFEKSFVECDFPLGKASKKKEKKSDLTPPLESDKNIFYFFWILDHFLSTF